MALWIWFLSVGGMFFFMVYGVHAAQMKSRRHDVRHELLLGKQKAPDARSPASSLRINPLRDISRESRQAPSSMYHGHEWFFDSVEHRDMFEANQHEPVTKDSDCSHRRSNKAVAYREVARFV